MAATKKGFFQGIKEDWEKGVEAGRGSALAAAEKKKRLYEFVGLLREMEPQIDEVQQLLGALQDLDVEKFRVDPHDLAEAAAVDRGDEFAPSEKPANVKRIEELVETAGEAHSVLGELHAELGAAIEHLNPNADAEQDAPPQTDRDGVDEGLQSAQREGPGDRCTCGAALKGGAQFCAACGMKVGARRVSRFCPQCGAELDANSKFCGGCGSARG